MMSYHTMLCYIILDYMFRASAAVRASAAFRASPAAASAAFRASSALKERKEEEKAYI